MRSYLTLRAIVLGTSTLLPLLQGCTEQDPGRRADGPDEASAAVIFARRTQRVDSESADGGTSASAVAGDAGARVDSTASGIPATFDTVKLVFGGGGPIMSCGAAPCHGVGGAAPPARPLELPSNNDALLYESLRAYVSEACGGRRLVVPGSPEESALMAILRGRCGETPRMPYGCTEEAGDCIPSDYIDAVALWITNGAAAN
jgi:hypothetical protein